MPFISGKHVSPPDGPARDRRHRGPAVSRRHGAARGPWSRNGECRLARSDEARLHRDGARAAGSTEWGASQHLWFARRGRAGFRPRARRPQPARAVPEVPDDRQRHRRAAGRSDHAAGNRWRPLPIERGVPHPVASEADEELGCARRDLAGSDLPPTGSARTRRFRRCSSASRTSIRPEDARTATRVCIQNLISWASTTSRFR